MTGSGSSEKSREDRLKKALKANMARRKAQARARAATDDAPDPGVPPEQDNNKSDEKGS
ncbi:MAG: hypothetical protein AAFY97_01930 [Pseudomonadota bacterium]